MTSFTRISLSGALCLLWLAAPSSPGAADASGPFVDAADVVPELVVDMRYAGPHNFLGRPVDGYESPSCRLTRDAAGALARVQAELLPFGLGLKVYDCYRPQRAVDDFVRWSRDPKDVRTRAEFYPAVEKADLFREGYIASRSSHSRGSTVDLTIVPLPQPPVPPWPPTILVACDRPATERWHDGSLDMGTEFDCFAEASATRNPDIEADQRGHRLLLKHLMERHGFINYAQEWWHFTLADEPYPETFFDIPIRAAVDSEPD